MQTQAQETTLKCFLEHLRGRDQVGRVLREKLGISDYFKAFDFVLGPCGEQDASRLGNFTFKIHGEMRQQPVDGFPIFASLRFYCEVREGETGKSLWAVANRFTYVVRRLYREKWECEIARLNPEGTWNALWYNSTPELQEFYRKIGEFLAEQALMKRKYDESEKAQQKS